MGNKITRSGFGLGEIFIISMGALVTEANEKLLQSFAIEYDFIVDEKYPEIVDAISKLVMILKAEIAVGNPSGITFGIETVYARVILVIS